MPDREKTIKCLEACTGATDDCAGHTCPYWDFDDSAVDWGCRIQMEKDALELLKEQEYRDKMFHALEDDWKLLKELLKEQETMNVDTFMQWCIDSHIMGDATVRGIKYWVEKFKEGIVK